MEEPKNLKLPKNHELKFRWYQEGSDMKDLVSVITYHKNEERYYLWKVLKDGKLEKVKTKQTPDFSTSELNTK